MRSCRVMESCSGGSERPERPRTSSTSRCCRGRPPATGLRDRRTSSGPRLEQTGSRAARWTPPAKNCSTQGWILLSSTGAQVARPARERPACVAHQIVHAYRRPTGQRTPCELARRHQPRPSVDHGSNTEPWSRERNRAGLKGWQCRVRRPAFALTLYWDGAAVRESAATMRGACHPRRRRCKPSSKSGRRGRLTPMQHLDSYNESRPRLHARAKFAGSSVPRLDGGTDTETWTPEQTCGKADTCNL